MNFFKTNEPFRLVVENYCSQQIINTKNSLYIYIYVYIFILAAFITENNLFKNCVINLS